MTNRRSVFIAVLIGLALVVTACGAAVEKLSEEAVEQAIESGGGGDVELDMSGEGDDFTVKVDSEDGSFSVGSGVEVPEQLQTPVPGGGSATTAGTQDDDVFVAIQYPGDQYEQIVAFYDDWTASTGSEWSTSTSTMELDGQTQRSASWSSDDGGVYLYVGDCMDFSSEGDSLNATCVTINETN